MECDNQYPKKTSIKQKFKWLLHRIRVWIALLLGAKHSKISKLVDSTLYEIRILTIVTFSVIGFYIFVSGIEDSKDPAFYQMIIKFNFIIMILIIFLVLKVILKLNHNMNNHKCNYDSEHHCDTSWKPNQFKEDCYKTCHYIKTPTKDLGYLGVHSHKFDKDGKDTKDNRDG